MKPKLICILGETASGKDSVTREALRELLPFDVRMVCSYTDRPIRESETDGIEHYFVTTDEFNHIKNTRDNDILAYTHIKKSENPSHPGYQYMALTDELQIAHVYVIDYLGLLNLKERFGDQIDTVIVYITAPYNTRMERSRKTRSDFTTEFQIRVDAEEAQFNDFRNSNLKYYKIINDDGDFDMSVNRLARIIIEELLMDHNISNYPLIHGPETNS